MFVTVCFWHYPKYGRHHDGQSGATRYWWWEDDWRWPSTNRLPHHEGEYGTISGKVGLSLDLICLISIGLVYWYRVNLVLSLFVVCVPLWWTCKHRLLDFYRLIYLVIKMCTYLEKVYITTWKFVHDPPQLYEYLQYSLLFFIFRIML